MWRFHDSQCHFCFLTSFAPGFSSNHIQDEAAEAAVAAAAEAAMVAALAAGPKVRRAQWGNFPVIKTLVICRGSSNYPFWRDQTWYKFMVISRDFRLIDLNSAWWISPFPAETGVFKTSWLLAFAGPFKFATGILGWSKPNLIKDYPTQLY